MSKMGQGKAKQGEARGETQQSRLAWNYEPDLPELKSHPTLQEWKS